MMRQLDTSIVRIMAVLLALALACGRAHADSDGVRSAVVVVWDQADPIEEAHWFIRKTLSEALAQGDAQDQLGIVTIGGRASVLVKLQPLGNKQAFAPIAKVAWSRSSAVTDGVARALSMLKASKVRRRRVVLVSHAKKLPAAVVEMAAKFREEGIEIAALGFQNHSFDPLATFAPPEETYIALDSPAFNRFFRVALGWIRCNGC